MSLNAEFIQRFDQAVRENPGTCSLKLKIFDAHERVEVGLLSRTVKVSPRNELILQLEAFDGVRCNVV